VLVILEGFKDSGHSEVRNVETPPCLPRQRAKSDRSGQRNICSQARVLCQIRESCLFVECTVIVAFVKTPALGTGIKNDSAARSAFTRIQSSGQSRTTLVNLLKTKRNLLYTGCPRRNGQNFGRVFLMLNYTDITQNTYIQS